MDKITIIILLYLFFTASYTISHGFFNFSSVISLLIFLLVFLLVRINWSQLKQSSSNLTSLGFLLLSSLLLSLLYYGGLYQNGLVVILSEIILAVSLLYYLLSFINFTKSDLFSFRNVSLFLLLAAVVLKILMVVSSKEPQIDAFFQLRDGVFGFLQGQNPYELTFPPLYFWHEANYFTYLPIVLYFSIPSVVIFHDPRFILIIAELIAAFSLYRSFGKNHASQLLALSYLYLPLSFYVLEESYADILIAAFLVVALCLLKKKTWSNLFLAFFFSSKLIFLSLVPLFVKSFRLSFKSFAFIVGVIFLLVVPFIVVSPADFWADTVVIYSQTKEIFLPISLSLPALFNKMALNFPYFISWLVLLFVYFFLFFRQDKSLEKLLLSVFLFLFLLSFFSWQAFVNNYYLLGVILLLLLGVVLQKGQNKST